MTLAFKFELLPTTRGAFNIYSTPMNALTIYTEQTSAECKEVDVRTVHRVRE
jgi:hypothetical protein